jgi:hypothetical protein
MLLCCLSGVAGGLGGATLGLALVNKSVEALTVEQAETLLVAGPLVGLLPEACLLLAARKDSRVARLLPAAFGLWLAAGVVSFAWLGLSPLLR